MDRTLILKRFKEIGLKPSEAKTYLSLLEKDTLTVSEVAKLSGIPRANAYHALEELMSKGMCVARPGETKKYRASDPALLVEKFHIQANEATERELQSLTQKEKEILEQNKATKDKITAVLKALRPQYEKSRLETNPLDYIEVIKDPFQMHKRFMQLLGEAKKELLGFTKPPFSVSQEGLERQAKEELDMLRRGVKTRSICEIPKDKDEREWLYRLCETLGKFGDRTRVVKEVPMKMMIFDSRIVMLALEDPVSKQPSFTTQIVEHRALAKTLKMTFEALWARAKDYHALKD